MNETKKIMRILKKKKVCFLLSSPRRAVRFCFYIPVYQMRSLRPCSINNAPFFFLINGIYYNRIPFFSRNNYTYSSALSVKTFRIDPRIESRSSPRTGHLVWTLSSTIRSGSSNFESFEKVSTLPHRLTR